MREKEENSCVLITWFEMNDEKVFMKLTYLRWGMNGTNIRQSILFYVHFVSTNL